MSTTVYTVILDAHDNLRTPFVNPSARYVCYADEPLHRVPWQIQPAYQPYGNVRDSRIPKILSHLHVDSEYSIYHDGCFVIACDPEELAAEWINDADIALFRHPGRPDIYSEAAYCRRDAGVLNFDEALADAIDAQVGWYRREGFYGAPFFAGGIIVRRENAAVREFNEFWWREYMAGCRRDQFSLAYAVWKTGIRVRIIEGESLLTRPEFSFNFHANYEDSGLNPEYKTERLERRARMDRLRALCA